MSTPYAQLLGPDLERLPTPCRAVHGGFGRFDGWITVEASPVLPLRLLARFMQLPGPVERAPLSFATEPHNDGARWTRRIAGKAMVSTQRAMPDGTLAETLGPVRIGACLVPAREGLHLRTAWVRLLGLPLPRVLWPDIDAREWAEDGFYRFEISVSLPLCGPRLIAYRGALDPASFRSP